MPQIPLPVQLVFSLLVLLAPPTGAAKKTAVAECWSDGRKDVLVYVDECPPALPPLEEIPLWLSWYDPALCYDEEGNVIENINCNEDPTKMAGGTAVTEDMYGYAGVCLPQWFDRRLAIAELGVRHCLDTGGAVLPTYREIYHPQRGFITLWLIPFDALEHYTAPPWWEYGLVEPDDWQVVEE